jgi:PAS domain S-box-containing protein
VAVVGLTRDDDPVLSRQAVHDGAEDVLVLPIANGGRMVRALRHAVERHQIHAALRLQAEQHSALVEGSIQGIVIHQDGVIRYANRSIARLMGYQSPAEIIGMGSLDHIAPYERERMLAMGEARRRGEAVPDRYEFQLQRRDGTYVTVDCMVTPVIWEGRPATVGTMLDVTEQRRNETGDTRALRDRPRADGDGGPRGGDPHDRDAGPGGVPRRPRRALPARPRPGHMTCVAAAGDRVPESWIGRVIRVGDGVTGLAVAEARPVWSADTRSDPRITLPDALSAFMREQAYRSGAAVPLMVGGRPMGGLFLGDPPGHTFGPADISLLTAFADRAALAVDKAALYERGAARAENLAVLARVSGSIASATGTAEVFEAVARAAITLFGAAAAGVLVDDSAAGLLRVGPHFRSDATPWEPDGIREVSYGRGVAGGVFQTREPAFIEDVQAEPRWVDKVAVEKAGFHGYAGIPLVARDRALGVLSVFFGERPTFTTEERELMVLLATQAAIAMDNARLLQETERRRRAAESLAEVGRLIAQSLDAAEVSGRITASVRTLLGVTNAALFRFRPETNDLESLSLLGDHGPTDGNPIVFPMGFGAAGLAVRERRAVVTPDLLSDPRIIMPPGGRERMERAPFRAVLAVPLDVHGRVVGCLVLGDPVAGSSPTRKFRSRQAFRGSGGVRARDDAALCRGAGRPGLSSTPSRRAPPTPSSPPTYDPGSPTGARGPGRSSDMTRMRCSGSRWPCCTWAAPRRSAACARGSRPTGASGTTRRPSGPRAAGRSRGRCRWPGCATRRGRTSAPSASSRTSPTAGSSRRACACRRRWRRWAGSPAASPTTSTTS